MSELDLDAIEANRRFGIVDPVYWEMAVDWLIARVRDLERKLDEYREGNTQLRISREHWKEDCIKRGKRVKELEALYRESTRLLCESTAECGRLEARLAEATRAELERCLGIVDAEIVRADAEGNNYGWEVACRVYSLIQADSPTCPACPGCHAPLHDGTDYATVGGETRHCRCLGAH